MKNRIFAFLRPFDIFGLVPLMTFARAPRVYSRLSMLLSLSTLAIILFIVLYLGIAVVQRKNPSFFQYRLPSTSNNEKLMFGAETFPIKFSTEVGTLVYGTDFFLDAYVATDYPTYTIFEFDEAPCADDPTLECFPQTQDVGKSYLVNAGDDVFGIDFSICSTPGVGCASSSDIADQLSSSFWTIYYTDQVVDPYNYDEPIKSRFISYGEPYQAYVNKRIYIYLEEIEFTTDDGWIFESLTTQRQVSVNRIQSSSADVTNDYRGSIFVKYTGDKNVYRRTYPKLQDLLAQISGIVGVMIPVVALLAFPFAEMKMREYMVNELYEVKFDKKDGSAGPGKDKGKPQSKEKAKNKVVRSEKVKVKAKPAANSILPANFGVNRQKIEEQGSPQKRLMSSSPLNAKGKMSENNSPFSESFETSKALGNENDLILERSTAGLQVSGFKSSVEPNKISFDNNQTKINTLKKPSPMQGKGQLELIPLGEGDKKLAPPPKDDDDLLDNKVIDEQENEPEKVEDDNDEEAIEVRGQPVFLNEARHSDKLNLTFGQFLKSFWRPQPEIEIIKKVQGHLTDAMDLASLTKKASDLDKLKSILFTPEERAIFDNLPVSVVTFGVEREKSKSKFVVNHYQWEQSMRGNVEKVNEAYLKLRDTEEKTDLQRKLLGFYESQYLQDYIALSYSQSKS